MSSHFFLYVSASVRFFFCFYLSAFICLLLSVCFYLSASICLLLSVCFYLSAFICLLLSVRFILCLSLHRLFCASSSAWSGMRRRVALKWLWCTEASIPPDSIENFVLLRKLAKKNCSRGCHRMIVSTNPSSLFYDHSISISLFFFNFNFQLSQSLAFLLIFFTFFVYKPP